MSRVRTCVLFMPVALLAALASPRLINASDHGDVPHTATVSREDANITDLHAFVRGEWPDQHLVVALSTNAAIPNSATSYVFPSDVRFEINVDVDALVDPNDPNGDGGTVLQPERIKEDLVYRITFGENGSPDVRMVSRGLQSAADLLQTAAVFAGLRDDPFIRIPRDGRNVGAIVLETPLAPFVQRQNTILVWATSAVDEFDGPFQDAAGRALRSMFPENSHMNTMPPNQHDRRMGVRPDVLILDSSRPVKFPNGRALTDDVVLEACWLSEECRVFESESRPMTPRSNDVPFLSTFPYLAPPHLNIP